MLDITRDKPIKVAVRVAVPVRDHPKFNFVGKLLGPKGNSMKRLQEETMCKMAVLGRGSMKDRKKEEELRLSGDPRYSHLADDLHVEISTFAAPAEAHARIAYALAEVRRFLVPDYHDDIRQEQMWEMQALNTTTQNSSLDSSNGLDLLGAGSSIGGNCSGSDHESNCDNQTSNLNNNNNSCDSMNMQIDMSHPTTPTSTTTTSHIPHATAILQNGAQHHQIQTTILPACNGSNGLPGNALHHSSTTQNNLSEIDPQTVTLVDPSCLHPALRGVKSVNISGLARKRPLLGAPRSSMNPTKRTVMTLLARAKNAQALHNARTGITSLGEPIQMITSPLILQQPLDMIQHNGNGGVAVPKENILQGV